MAGWEFHVMSYPRNTLCGAGLTRLLGLLKNGRQTQGRILRNGMVVEWMNDVLQVAFSVYLCAYLTDIAAHRLWLDCTAEQLNACS